MAVIEVKELTFAYQDGTKALDQLNLTIPTGKKVALLGPNGAGKSTLLLHLNGIHMAQSGLVRVMGRQIDSSTDDWVRSKVGLVFQDPDDQIFSTTVWEDVAFGPTNMALPHQEVSARVEAALTAVGMWEQREKAPHHLSYGQKKRVAIAGVLAMNPEVIVLDEPVAFLDPQGKDTLFGILEDLNRQGTTVVIATHDVDLAAEWVDEVIIIKGGKCLAQGSPQLLAEETIVRQAQLRFPIITRLFQQLPELKLNRLPQTVAEGAKLIKQIVKG